MEITFGLIIGLAVGSFINVLVDRLPKKEGFLFGRSRCPHCRTNLRWYELVPILSFIVLRGRCSSCRQKISWRYPLIEALAGVGFFLLATLFAGNLAFLLWLLVLFSILVFIAAYDARHLIIPDWSLVALLVWVLAGKLIFERGTIVLSVLAGIILASFFLFIFVVSRGRWLGGGDVKLAAALGFWVAWPKIIVLLGAAYLAGGLVSGLLLVSGRAGPKHRIAFGPFLLFGALAAFLYGNEIIQWYLGVLSR